MVAYNQEDFIDEAIRGVVLQAFEYPYEIIIGDDCSTDSTFEHCQKWQQKYPHLIKIVRHKENLGIQRNYIDIYNRCQGEYIAICEGDDFWCSKYKLQRQVDYMDTHADCNICFHRIVNYYADSKTMSLSNGGQKSDTTIIDLSRSNYITNLSVMYRRNAVKSLPDWLAEVNPPDYILHMLHASDGNIHYINKPMGVYRQHKRGVWGGNITEQRLRMSIDTRKKLIEHFVDNKAITSGLISAYTPIALNLMIYYESIGESQKSDAIESEILKYNKSWNKSKLYDELLLRKQILSDSQKPSINKFLKKCRAIASTFIPVPRIKN